MPVDRLAIRFTPQCGRSYAASLRSQHWEVSPFNWRRDPDGSDRRRHCPDIEGTSAGPGNRESTGRNATERTLTWFACQFAGWFGKLNCHETPNLSLNQENFFAKG